jgi:Type II CAAX prenyl endopeptidase Rce1-like
MKLRWPPHPLGLGTPLNLAALSPEARSRFARAWWRALAAGLAAALAVVAVDAVFFGGQTLRQTPDLGAHPPIGNRVGVAIIGSLVEEVLFRLGIATASAWLVYLVLRRLLADARSTAQWAGVLAAAAAAGWMHVGQTGDPAAVWRIMTVNAIINCAYGWAYWHRGLEFSVLTHAITTSILYIGVPALR